MSSTLKALQECNCVRQGIQSIFTNQQQRPRDVQACGEIEACQSCQGESRSSSSSQEVLNHVVSG